MEDYQKANQLQRPWQGLLGNHYKEHPKAVARNGSQRLGFVARMVNQQWIEQAHEIVG
jgi:hypothetical protein